ncbi:hypothetical protein ACFLTH_03800 [Bacteroidota bacterium]
MFDFGDDMQVDYHRPSDDFEKINYEKVYKTVSFLEALTTNTANLDHRLEFSGKL